MFRRVQDAARKGRSQAKSLLARVGRAMKTLGRKAKTPVVATGKAAFSGVRFLIRGVSWCWMSFVEVASLTQAPFTWVLGNILFASFRGAEWLVGKIRKDEYYWWAERFPAFSLPSANGFNNAALYPLIALVGWLLSPLTGKVWWEQTAWGYKVRTVSLVDFDFEDRTRKDLNMPTRGDSIENYVEARMDEQREAEIAAGPELTADRFKAQGLQEIFIDPNVPESANHMYFEYLEERVQAVDPANHEHWRITITPDAFGRYWADMPRAVDLTPPPLRPEGIDELGLNNFEVTEVHDDIDYTSITDPKERSYFFGVFYVRESMKQFPNFLESEELQNKARALVFKESKNPQTGLLPHYAIKGFTEELERAQISAGV